MAALDRFPQCAREGDGSRRGTARAVYLPCCRFPRDGSSACTPFGGRCRSLARDVLGLELEKLPRLARERLADRIERREPDGARFTSLEDREVRQGHADPIRELGERHPPIVKEIVEFHDDRHVKPSPRGPDASQCLPQTREPAETSAARRASQ